MVLPVDLLYEFGIELLVNDDELRQSHPHRGNVVARSLTNPADSAQAHRCTSLKCSTTAGPTARGRSGLGQQVNAGDAPGTGCSTGPGLCQKPRFDHALPSRQCPTPGQALLDRAHSLTTSEFHVHFSRLQPNGSCNSQRGLLR